MQLGKLPFIRPIAETRFWRSPPYGKAKVIAQHFRNRLNSDPQLSGVSS
jgi:hypothetical protein